MLNQAMLKPYTGYVDKDKDNLSQARTVYSAPTGMIFHNHILPSEGAQNSRPVSAQKQRPRSANASARRENKVTANQNPPAPVPGKNDPDYYGQTSRYASNFIIRNSLTTNVSFLERILLFHYKNVRKRFEY